MIFPTLIETNQTRDMVTAFGGYNHNISCADGQFYDMKNMTSQGYPVLSPRLGRTKAYQLVNPQGVLNKENIMWVDDGKLYEDGKEVKLNVTLNNEPKQMEKMGAYVVIFPDKVWYNADTKESGYMEASYEFKGTVSFTICDSYGSAITYHDAAYYQSHTPSDGDYMITESNGITTLKQYSSSASIWGVVTSTYVKVGASGIGMDFLPNDGVKIQVNLKGISWPKAKDIFVNDEGGGWYSTNTIINEQSDGYITIPGLIDGNKTFNMSIKVKRSVPDMAYVTECQNRIWGCSKDGHEIYCCKLGDVTNWNCFEGISTDSYAVTIGSDGKFTGAVTHLGYPIFFKEDSLIKIFVSSTGAHQLKETACRGVQNGSNKSLCVVNETLYYKAVNGIVAYQGSLPVSISDVFGEVRYSNAVSGTIDNRYYVSMQRENGKYEMFTFDIQKGIWNKEDNTQVFDFCQHGELLYYIDTKDNMMKCIGEKNICKDNFGGKDKSFDWYVESGDIGYSSPDFKCVTRINLRIALELGTEVDFYMQYDSDGIWEHKFSMSGNGTRAYSIPIVPKRCDHFKYKIQGRGGAKIFSISKTTEQGSDGI